MPFLLSAKISLIYRNYIRTMEKYSFTNKQKYNTCDSESDNFADVRLKGFQNPKLNNIAVNHIGLGVLTQQETSGYTCLKS